MIIKAKHSADFSSGFCLPRYSYGNHWYGKESGILVVTYLKFQSRDPDIS